MGKLFGSSEENAIVKQEAAKTDLAFLEAAEDDPDIFEGIRQVSFLSISQGLSDVVTLGEATPGRFILSSTKEDLGKVVNVIVIGFKTMWTEKDARGRSVRRVLPNSIPVNGDTFTGMTDATTGAKIEETLVFFCLLPDRGYEPVILTGGAGQMRYMRRWANMMRNLRTPSGAKAKPWAGIWELTIGADQNKNQQNYFSLKGGIKFVDFISAEAYQKYIPEASGIDFTRIVLSSANEDGVTAQVTEDDD